MKMNLMKKLLSTFGAVALLILCTTDAKAQELPAVFSAEIRDDLRDPPIRDFMGEVNTAFFNVQGDDDDFVVYSLVDFDTTSIDTSGGTVSGISSLTLDLSQANAVFSTSGDLAFFLASDTRAVEVTDTARFMSDRANGGANTGADVHRRYGFRRR